MTLRVENLLKATLVIFSALGTRLMAHAFPKKNWSARNNFLGQSQHSFVGTMKSSVIEIEEKFILGDIESLKSRLGDLGFSPDKTVEMTDWYFDLPSQSLMRNDCWLRFREANGKGDWQLKIGKHDREGSSTVYEEVEGTNALEMACDLGASSQTTEDAIPTEMSFEGYDVPEFPISGAVFSPFARIHTQRETWKNPREKAVVDLDATDFGYGIGEVEIVVNHESEIEKARERIGQLILTLRGTKGEGEGGSSPQAKGKLEYFLEKNCPALYELCLQIGVLQY
jgi:adenylate cyclase class IV